MASFNRTGDYEKNTNPKVALPLDNAGEKVRTRDEIVDLILKGELDAVTAKAELAKADQTASGDAHGKVAMSGAFSVYLPGLQMPVTLYAASWRTLLARAKAIGKALDANANRLSQGRGKAPANPYPNYRPSEKK